MPASDIQVRPVAGRRELKAFIRLPHTIYADDPAWVAPLDVERRQHLSRRNPFFRHGEGTLFIAWRGKQPVGRISAQINHLHLQRYPDEPPTGFFGFIEGIDDPHVFRALLDTAAAWLKERGMQRMRGPFSWSINQESGLLAEGFDTPPAIMMGHARPWYDAHVRAAGLQKVMDLLAYDYTPDMGQLEQMQRFAERFVRKGDLQVRPLNRRRLREELDLIMDIFNDAWADNWGFVPFTPEEISQMAQEFRLLLDDNDIAIASWKGEPAAMAVAVPDINNLIADFHGRLFPFNWARLIWRLKFSKRPKRWRMPLMGVRRKFHNSSISAALATAVILAVNPIPREGERFAGGEFSWILETNRRVRRLIESSGSHVYKTYRIYERAID